jgi:signal transduction histidine kinase
MRLWLAVALLAASFFGRRPAAAPVLAFLAFSSAVYLLSQRHSRLLRIFSARDHWADGAWLAALSAGPDGGLFCTGFLFPIVVASIRCGFAMSMVFTAAAAGSLFLIGFLSPAALQGMLPGWPVILLVLGTLIARRGAAEHTLKRRIQFLAESTRCANPRLGADHLFDIFLERVRGFYNAETSVLVIRDLGSGQLVLRRSQSGTEPREGESLPSTLAERLLELPSASAVVYRNAEGFGRLHGRPYIECNLLEGGATPSGRQASRWIAAALDAESFVSVPVFYRNQVLGRLFVVSGRRASFEDSDIYFLIQALGIFLPVIDNVRLVDRLTVEGAAGDRRRIARDLHDGALQPYLGLRIGLDALRTRMAAGTLEPSDIEQLIRLADSGISELRGYVGRLRGQTDPGCDLPRAVTDFAREFEEATGISIKVDVGLRGAVSSRLASEAYLIVREGLSNIRRHTDATAASVSLTSPDGELLVVLENEGCGKLAQPFLPRSILERAESLGGSALVQPKPDGGSTVTVKIPL